MTIPDPDEYMAAAERFWRRVRDHGIDHDFAERELRRALRDIGGGRTDELDPYVLAWGRLREQR